MIKFFLGNNVYGRIVAGILLLSFFMLNISSAGILFSVPIANAEVDAPTPQPALLMRAYEGTGAPPIICTRDSNESFTEYCAALGFATGVSAEISRADADVTLEWTLDQTPVYGGWAGCTLYGGVASRTVSPKSDSLVLQSPTPGIYILTCHDSANIVTTTANVQLRVGGSSYPSGNYSPFSCWNATGGKITHYDGSAYKPDALIGPQPPNKDRASLKDIFDSCKIDGMPQDSSVGGAAPWLVDDKIGWPATVTHTERTTSATYKDAQTIAVCTKAVVDTTRYRIGATWHSENLGGGGEAGSGVDYYVYDPFEISHEGPIQTTTEECDDRALNDDIISATIPQCGTDENIGIISITYTYHCDTNTLAANGKVAACHYEKKTSLFGGIISWALLVTGPLLGWLGSMYSILATILSVASTAVGLASGVSQYLSEIQKIAISPILGTVGAPDRNLGECTWSEGFAPKTVGAPACTSGCAFEKKTIIEGQKVKYPWNFNSAVSSIAYACTGDLGSWSGKVPADVPYSGTSEFSPKKTQTCTLTLSNSAGATKTYTDTITVNPLAGGPSCSLTMFPGSIQNGDNATFGWHFSPDTSKVNFACTGDLGGQTGMRVPQDIGYDSEAVVTPTRTQSCTATVFAVSGEKGTCSASISVGQIAPPPPPPVVSAPSVTNACTSDEVSRVAIAWDTGSGGSGYVVDIDNDNNWGTGFWNKGIATGITTIKAPEGFGGGFGESGSLNLISGATYQTRIFYPATGVHSPTGSFVAPVCTTIPPPPPPPPPVSTGDLYIRATLNGVPWPASGSDSSIKADYATPYGSGANLPVTIPTNSPSLTVGNYTFTYVSGGPAGAVFTDTTPSATQTLTAGGSVTFTFNFLTSSIPPAPQQNIVTADSVCFGTSASVDLQWSTATGCDVSGDNWLLIYENGTLLTNPSPIGFGPNAFSCSSNAVLNNRTANTTHTYRFVPRNDSSYAYTVSKTTPVCTVTPPPPPPPVTGSGAELLQTSFTTLSGFNSGCTLGNAISSECNAAVSDYCLSKGFGSGFGPSEYGGDIAYVTCLSSSVASLQYVGFTTLASYHSACSEPDHMSGGCYAAYRRYCAASGYESGFGPIKTSGGSTGVVCTTKGISALTHASFAELTAQHSGCTSANAVSGACNAAIRRYCGTKGFLGGFGPNEYAGNDAYVTCVRTNTLASARRTSLWATVLGAFVNMFTVRW